MEASRTKSCSVCLKQFIYKNKSRDKTCSRECRSAAISKSKLKYSDTQIAEVVSLKRQSVPNHKISSMTGVKISKVKEIVKNNGLFLPKDRAQQNARNGLSLPVMEHMKKMRDSISSEAKEVRERALKNWRSSDKAKEMASKKMEKVWSVLKSDPEKFKTEMERRGKHLSEHKLGISHEEYEKKLLQIKKDVEDHKGTVSTLCKEHGLSPVTTCRAFHKRGWGDLVSVFASQGQIDVYSYIKSIYDGEVILNDRKTLPMELDIYVPEYKLAIEYNGLYWHSSANLENKPSSHKRKKALCQSSGIDILAVYEDEWANDQKRELIKAMIRYRLKRFLGSKIRASELKVVKLEKNAEFKAFFERNHIDGHTLSSYAYALVDENNRMYVCISIRRNFNKEWEIARLATDYDFVVQGGVQKLLKYLPKPIVSYSNNRLSSGNVYLKMGFEEITETTQPSYWYTDLKTRVWRFKCRRINDPSILALFPTEKDQAENGVFSQKIFGDSRPLYKIEDYGHRKWILEK